MGDATSRDGIAASGPRVAALAGVAVVGGVVRNSSDKANPQMMMSSSSRSAPSEPNSLQSLATSPCSSMSARSAQISPMVL